MKATSSFIAVLAALSTSVSASLYPDTSPNNHTCALSPDHLSCSDKATPDNVDTCCVETFGGLLLLTQFWTIYTGYEDEGQLLPRESWGVHGLWPDFCNGSYTQYCDLDRQYDPEPSPNTTNGQPDGTPVPPYTGAPIDPFTPFGRYDLKAWMEEYWIARGQPNWYLWAHEFSKHATCFSTFDIPCYGPKYQRDYDMIEFFETAAMYFLRLPTYDWLADAKITPSNSTSYTLSDIEAALSKEYGAVPFVGCAGPSYNETEAGAGSDDDGRTELSELWYYFHSYGKPQDGRWEPTPQTTTSSCAKAKGAVWYYERAKGSERAVPNYGNGTECGGYEGAPSYGNGTEGGAKV